MGILSSSEERQQKQLYQLINPGWVTAFITILILIVSLSIQWGRFAQKEYVDTKFESVQAKENDHYIELLKAMNEIKVIVEQNKTEERKYNKK